MIGERNVASATARTTGVAVFYNEAVTLVFDLRWIVTACLVLIVADLWFGVSESRMQGREVRRSKMCRRTMNKAVDYLLYMIMAGVMGKAFGEPFGLDYAKVAAAVMLFVCAWEMDSIYGHWCVLRGAEKDFSVRKFVLALFRKKGGGIGEAVEEATGNYDK